MRLLWRMTIALLALIGAASLVGIAWFWWGGISARAEPGRFETALARQLRAAAVPREARSRANPEPQTPQTLQAGLEHFADHCATCHANDGSGGTELGRSMYPRAPDMREAATQRLSDGELFYIIEHGVRLTGMPAWSTGTAEGEAASWHLVQFIRHLPKLTESELQRMRELNPRSAEAWREEEEIRRFLEGEAETPPAGAHRSGHGGER